MAGEALRKLYAEVGWKIDEAPLQRLDKLLDDIKASMLGGAVERFEKDLEDATDDAKKLAKELSDADKEVKDLGRDMKITGKTAVSAMDEAADEAQRLKRETKDAGEEAERSRRKFQRFGDALNRIGRGMTSGIWRMGTSILRAPFSLPGMLIGGAATYGAVQYGFVNPLKMASEFEQAEIAFTTMLGSAEKARDFIEEMNRFAAATPFDVAGVQEAAKRMLAFGFRQEQIIPYLTAIGNAAAGLGGGSDLIDRISLAIGQMQAKAKVSAEEMLQLTEAGIPAWDILSKKMGKSTQELMKMTSKGLIPAEKAIAMLIEGMNERFPNMLQKQADSLDGLKNQIVETFSLRFIKRWGDGLARALKPRFQEINRWIDQNEDKIQRWGQALEKAAYEGFDYLLRQGERVFGFIRRNYLENEEFQKLPFNKKIEVVFADIERKFRSWYNGGGKRMIEKGAQKFVDFTIGVIQDNLPKIAKIGVDIGKSLASGILQAIMEDPLLATLLGGYGAKKLYDIFGPADKTGGKGGSGKGLLSLARDPRVLAGTAAVASVGYLASSWENAKQDPNSIYSSRIYGGPGSIYGQTAQPTTIEPITYTPEQLEKIQNQLKSYLPGHASGLPYVPKDNYIARLHEGERVLTKQENREYTRGRAQATMPPINATINVNVSATAAAGGSAAVREAARQGAREGLEEFWRSLRRNYPAITEV